MAKRRPYTLLDVFTATPTEGNQLAVVHAADAMTESQMHAFARETKLSETSFVQRSDAPGADYRHRIFMMSGEIPFAGHPSLGTAVAVAVEREEEIVAYRQQTRPGVQEVRVRRRDDTVYEASMLQERDEHLEEVDPSAVLAAVGLGPSDGEPGLPPQVVSTGARQLLLPLHAGALARARPDYSRIGPLLADHGAITLYCFEGEDRARSFLQTAEMGEDPATGSAVGPMLAYLRARRGTEAIEVRQGIEMGRPSRLRASWEGDRPRVAGDVVVLVRGTLMI